MLKDRVERILVVDDSATARLIIKQCLEICGFADKTFYEAGNGVEALKLLDEFGANLILMDLYMPKMDGRALLAEIKKRPEKPVVVVITSAANQAVEQELLLLGADAIAHKPVSPASLLQSLEKI